MTLKKKNYLKMSHSVCKMYLRRGAPGEDSDQTAHAQSDLNLR